MLVNYVIFMILNEHCKLTVFFRVPSIEIFSWNDHAITYLVSLNNFTLNLVIGFNNIKLIRAVSHALVISHIKYSMFFEDFLPII